jgi:type II secretory pathway pseudopilin PulG
MPNRDEAAAGFALLEALVALSMLAAGVAAVMSLLATNRRAQADADAELAAALQARSLMARIGRDLPLTAGTFSGTGGGGLAWSVRIAPFRDAHSGVDTPASAVLSVDLRIQDKLRHTLVEVSTLKRAPR